MFITRGQNRGSFEPKNRGLRTAIGSFPVRVYPKRGAEGGETRFNVYKNKAEILPGNKPGDIRFEEGTKTFTDGKVAYFLGGLQDRPSKVVDENGEPRADAIERGGGWGRG